MDTSFKYSTDELAFELEGGEDFVRGVLDTLLPYGRIEREEPEAPAALPQPGPLVAWFEGVMPRGQRPTMQDHILIFAYYLNREQRQFIFVPDDMKAAFRELDREIPKSLLQILGSLKRDRGLLYSGKKRGEYCITPAGLRHVEGLLGLERRPPGASAPKSETETEEKRKDDGSLADRLFQNLHRSEDPE